MDALPPGLTDPGNIGVVGLCVLLAIGYTRGWIHSDREYQQVVKDRDAWHAAYEDKRDEGREKDRQLRHMAEVGRTVERIMYAIGSPSRTHEDKPGDYR